jgi:hypothetical protein
MVTKSDKDAIITHVLSSSEEENQELALFIAKIKACKAVCDIIPRKTHQSFRSTSLREGADRDFRGDCGGE